MGLMKNMAIDLMNHFGVNTLEELLIQLSVGDKVDLIVELMEDPDVYDQVKEFVLGYLNKDDLAWLRGG